MDIIEYKKSIEDSSREMSRLKESYEQTLERCRTERAVCEETFDTRICSMKAEVRVAMWIGSGLYQNSEAWSQWI